MEAGRETIEEDVPIVKVGNKNAWTNCFLLFKTDEIKCNYEYLKASGTSLLVGCTV